MNQRQFEILNMLVEFNTESPPGRNTDPLQNEIELLLRDLGFSIQREHLYDNDSIIVATLKGEDSEAPKLILNGHVDVASVDDDQYWQYPPFKLTEVDGWLYGRGVSDMKGRCHPYFMFWKG